MINEYPYYLNYLEVKNSSLHGKGLFTNVDIPAESIICVIEGEVIDENECIRREEEEGNVYIFWNGDNYIDTAKNPLLRNINHLCEPNCYVEDRNESSLFLIAERDIKAGEELTIDYDYDEIYETCQCHIHKNEN
ncbi:MAG: SET domain-containing protein [Stygiobacter sp.]|jgi:SET domain-containing protein|uniref:SET domain-containing protein n=1 Tax=Stygiobacter electus TaxID=3032292 RepID=A0AAE3TD03_9BACT|nr:SET domain-containing protein [Stygiobacter electus]MDF1612465.1 SET domain-containing protein [Stygiobacter electus]